MPSSFNPSRRNHRSREEVDEVNVNDFFQNTIVPKKKNSNTEWNCTACTYLNEPNVIQCEVCDNFKPGHNTISEKSNQVTSNNMTSPETIGCSLNSKARTKSKLCHSPVLKPLSSLSANSALKDEASRQSDLKGGVSNTGSWSCQKCTFSNRALLLQCEMCWEKKPEKARLHQGSSDENKSKGLKRKRDDPEKKVSKYFTKEPEEVTVASAGIRSPKQSPKMKFASIFATNSKKKDSPMKVAGPKKMRKKSSSPLKKTKKRSTPSSLFGTPPKKRKRKLSTSPLLKKNKKLKRKKRKEKDPHEWLTPRPPSKYPNCEPWCLSLKSIVFTGRIEGWTMEKLNTLITRNGGKVRTDVLMMTSFVVTGTDPDSNLIAKATCPVYTFSKFLKLLPTLPQNAAPKIRTRRVKTEELWVDKYKPKSLSELVGNPHLVKRLQNYLLNWPRIKDAKSGTVKRACLLSGPPGLGKSSAAGIVAKEMGYRVLEFNASDARGRKVLQNNVQAATDTRSLSEFSQLGNKRFIKKPLVLIMDEVDGMSSGDRGGVSQLIQFIKTTKVPMLCICNDRAKNSIRTLVTYCEDLRFRRPNAESIASRMLQICEIENIQVSKDFLLRMASGLNGDIRQILNLLQLWSNTPERTIESDSLEKRMSIAQKDVTVGPWDVVPKFFSMHHKVVPKDRIYKGTEWFFVDMQIMPLFIYENYLTGSWNNCNISTLDDFADAAESMADGDLLDNRIREKQDYSLMPMFASLFCIKPCLITGRSRGIHGEGRRPNFPMWLGKNSSRNKNLQMLSDLYHHMSAEISGNKISVLEEYLPLLRTKLSESLLKNGESGISEVVDIMKFYSLSREDWDAIMDEIGVDLSKVLDDVYEAVKLPNRLRVKFTKECRDRNVIVYSDPKNKSVTMFKSLTTEEKEVDEEEVKKKKKKSNDSKFFKKKKGPKKKRKKSKKR